jgi:hypothetical protein
MPLQNKVDPFGAIRAVSMRGMFMGNRGGRMHDPDTKTLLPGKTHVSRQWITCLTEFKDRPPRHVMGPGSYTELFFLDEVVSLAAGHRPCAECRRSAFKMFCATIGPGAVLMKAGDLDRRLHTERTGEKLRLSIDEAAAIPDGSVVADGMFAFARRQGLALQISFAGYGVAMPWNEIVERKLQLLSPPTAILALRNGYKPVWHPSAGP